jgi:hypothetical protein
MRLIRLVSCSRAPAAGALCHATIRRLLFRARFGSMGLPKFPLPSVQGNGLSAGGN